MGFRYYILGFIPLIAGLFWGCQTSSSTHTLHLSTISSTDTVQAGTPAGMHLYMKKNGAFDLEQLLSAAGYSKATLQSVKINQIKIKVEIPETNFNPGNITAFSTAFSSGGVENTLVESNELDYTSRTYIINVQDEVSGLNKTDKVFDINGGLKLKDLLQYDVVLTTEVVLEAEVLM
ncbi:hypothetical protein GC194_02865 [bacterium]|nr:hypothetical protein [bacterium]